MCLSSHDLAPFKGWRECASHEDIAKLESAITEAGVNSGDLLADAHAFVAKTPCAIMLVQADDLTQETEPLNVPGTDTERPNWRRRLSVAVEAIADLATSKTVTVPFKRRDAARMGSSYKVEILAQEVLAKFWSTLSKVTLQLHPPGRTFRGAGPRSH